MDELHEKMDILGYFLEQCDDGRRKGFYCLAVNLLDVGSLRQVVQESATLGALTSKERAVAVTALLHTKADELHITLRLRTKAD